jgi:hypothetical protein
MIAICTPAPDIVKTRFAHDLTQVIARGGCEWIPSEGTVIPNQRTLLVREALQRNASHVLFLDSDMRFPADIISRMRAHCKPIVAANCIDKRSGNETVVRKGDEVISVGCAVMMIEKSVFQKLDEPWFAMPWDPMQKHLVGEDRYFCHRALQAGYQIFIDDRLSKLIKHIGAKEFGFD